ncbi:MAG: hypothetical protein ACOH10_14885, partial [Rhodoglobus sp.]
QEIRKWLWPAGTLGRTAGGSLRRGQPIVYPSFSIHLARQDGPQAALAQRPVPLDGGRFQVGQLWRNPGRPPTSTATAETSSESDRSSASTSPYVIEP